MEDNYGSLIATDSKNKPINKGKIQFQVNIDFPKVISTSTCSELVIETIKYIIYLKAQIPYQFDRLKYFVERKKKWEEDKKKLSDTSTINKSSISRIAEISVEKHYVKSSKALEDLELIFQELRKELSKDAEEPVDNIILLFGTNICSPQEAYVMELPTLHCVPASTPPSQACLVHLLKQVLLSENFRTLTSKVMQPSNVHVLLRKRFVSKPSAWLEVKPHFSLSMTCHRAVLSFRQPKDNKFEVYRDFESNTFVVEENGDASSSTSLHMHENLQWFQACKTVKGFKDCWIGEVCATELWTKI